MGENIDLVINRGGPRNINLIRQLILRDIFGGVGQVPPINRLEFDINDWSEDDCWTHFRFKREDIPRLVEALRIPDVVHTRSGHRATGIEALCILLKRLTYPNRLEDIKHFFENRSPSALSEISNFMASFITENYNHLLEDLHAHQWLNEEKLAEYSRIVAAAGAALQNCWAFLDGTIRPICRPTIDQELYYSGHKRVHCLKYQSLVTPDGITISCMGPFEGRRHDAGMLRESALYNQLEETAVFPRQNFVIYGDQAYGIRELLICPFPGNHLTPAQQHFNNTMSSVREAVEWSFAKVVNIFGFIDFKKNQKILLQYVQSFYKTATILTNCHSCLYGNQTADYFHINPINLEQYLNGH